MRSITDQQISAISGGWNYTPPENPDKEPFRAGVAIWGGNANYAIKQSVGIDITGDDPVYNKFLGTAVWISVITLAVVGIIRINPAGIFNPQD